MASSLSSAPGRVSLTLDPGSGPQTVAYVFDDADTGATANSLYREVNGSGARTVLLRNVQALEISRFAAIDGAILPAANDLETSLLELSFRLQGAAPASQAARSSRVVLRNRKL
jgi:hypothetical protein